MIVFCARYVTRALWTLTSLLDRTSIIGEGCDRWPAAQLRPSLLRFCVIFDPKRVEQSTTLLRVPLLLRQEVPQPTSLETLCELVTQERSFRVRLVQ